ncbi:MAG: S-adenosylmethionine (SAM)-dependent methyltransferase [Parcubacteria group bacterium Gr01-1014_38]|nr:MAG: S-adenosylmethionine (SAM)-dependent methyltransferase [Parcubacteria group bacterium Gr01-1014_38]
MIPLYKFPRAGVDRERIREESFARQHIAKQGPEDFARQDFWPLMKRYLRQGKTYLDVQCGTGGWVIFLHDEGYRVEGVDPSRRVAQAISEYEPEIPVRVARPTELPYADGSVDGIVAIGALESLEGRVPWALNEWRRVLREDGTLFFQVPYASPLRRATYLPLKQIEYAVKTELGQKPVFSAYLFTPSELARLSRAAGFAIVELSPHELPDPDAHFGLYHDWPFLRGERPYRLNAVGRAVKNLCQSISPWVVSTGLFAIAKVLPRPEQR